ncbi:MAG: amidohydrolase family protein [Mariniblastus sp.]
MDAVSMTSKKIEEGSKNMKLCFPFRFEIRFASALALALTCCCFAVTSNSDAQTIAYVDATIETLGENGQLKNATLVTRGDKIVDVGTDVEIPDDARVVSMKGKTIMPGMIDPYFVFQQNPSSASTRTVVFNGRTFTIPNRTATFSAGSFNRIGEYFYPYKFDFKPALRSGVTTGNLVSDGRGLSALANIFDDRTPAMLFKNDGFIFAKLTNATAALDVIRKPLTPPKTSSTASKTSTAKTTTSTKPKSSADEVKEMWTKVRDGKMPLFVNVNNQAGVAHLLKTIKEYKKVRLVLVATGPNLYETLDEIKANKNVTVVLQPGIDRVPFKSDLMNVSQMLATKEIPFAISMTLSGSQLRASQDDPMFPLAMLVRTGLDRETALKSVTMMPAKLLEIDKTHGSIEKDKHANLLIFDGDPLKTGSNLEQVILNGNQTYEN